MNNSISPTLIALVYTTIAVADGRLWPDGNGSLIRGEMVLSSPTEVVILTDKAPRRYVWVARASLRDIDKRYLHRLTRARDLTNLPEDMRTIAEIRDAKTLFAAASIFRGKDMQFVLNEFERYLALCNADRRLDDDNLWVLATTIFEHPQPLYPDFWRNDDALISPRWPQSSCEEIRFIDETPFWIPSKFGHSGPCWPDVEYLIHWVRNHARLRTVWLCPKSTPTKAIQALADEDAKYCRNQAWQLVSHLFGEKWKLVFVGQIEDERWEKLVTIIESLGLEWDVDLQRFRKTTDETIPEVPKEWLPTKFLGHFE